MRALWTGILVAAAAACGAAPDPALQADALSPSPCDPPAVYVACGCGCCGGLAPSILRVDRQTLCKVIADDQAIAGSPGCAMAGCSWPVQYELAGAPAKPASR